MAKPEIQHVMLHQSGWAIAPFIVILGIFIAVFGFRMLNVVDELNPEPSPPYVIDLRNEEYPTTLDYTSRYDIVVRVEKPDGVEVRLLDADDGKLVGTFIEKPSEQAATTPQ
ncbi:MAG: hypothetical protein ACKVS5_03420 [Parvularculaceae bacterium]